jgi:hypothetical protein
MLDIEHIPVLQLVANVDRRQTEEGVQMPLNSYWQLFQPTLPVQL